MDERFADSHPLKNQNLVKIEELGFMTLGFLAFAGDGIAQIVIEDNAKYDPKRGFRFLIFGSFLMVSCASLSQISKTMIYLGCSSSFLVSYSGENRQNWASENGSFETVVLRSGIQMGDIDQWYFESY